MSLRDEFIPHFPNITLDKELKIKANKHDVILIRDDDGIAYSAVVEKVYH